MALLYSAKIGRHRCGGAVVSEGETVVGRGGRRRLLLVMLLRCKLGMLLVLKTSSPDSLQTHEIMQFPPVVQLADNMKRRPQSWSPYACSARSRSITTDFGFLISKLVALLAHRISQNVGRPQHRESVCLCF